MTSPFNRDDFKGERESYQSYGVRRPKPGMFQPERLKDTVTMFVVPVGLIACVYFILRLAHLISF